MMDFKKDVQLRLQEAYGDMALSDEMRYLLQSAWCEIHELRWLLGHFAKLVKEQLEKSSGTT